jgi:hypothetical protein
VRGGARAARKSAASTATAAGSSTRAGIPCPARERRASSAPARRNAARSRSLRGCRALPRGVPVPPPASARYGPARAPGPGREDPPGGHSQGPAPGPARGPASPADPDRAARADGSGRCRSSLVCVRPVMRTGPVTSVAPWGAWQSASHGAVPAVSRGCAAGGEPAGPLSAGHASGRSARSMTRRQDSFSRGRSWAQPAAAAAAASPARRRALTRSGRS